MEIKTQNSVVNMLPLYGKEKKKRMQNNNKYAYLLVFTKRHSGRMYKN